LIGWPSACCTSWRRREALKAAKSPTTDRASSPLLAVYHLKGTPAKLVGIVFDQPDEKSAVKQAIEKFRIPANQRGRLIAQRRG
jgi:hypothetical protein